MRRWLVNRFTIVFGGLAVVVALWNVYVVFHDGGHLAGRVVGPDGAPVAGAVVTLSERTLLVTRPKAETVSDATGRFAFEGHNLFRLFLGAEKAGVGKAVPREVRLYFKGQDRELAAPLRLAAGT